MEINATLIGQLITFVILIWFIMKYVWPPITKALHERQKKIAAGIEAAERSKRELDNAEHKVLDMLRQAKAGAAQVVDQAHKRSAQILEEAKANAQQEATRLLNHAQQEIAREVSAAKDVLRKQLASLAIAGAEKVIQRNLDISTHTALLDEFVAEI